MTTKYVHQLRPGDFIHVDDMVCQVMKLRLRKPANSSVSSSYEIIVTVLTMNGEQSHHLADPCVQVSMATVLDWMASV